MLIRITWGLVLAGLGLVIAGFLNDDSNVLLILAIAAEIAAIVLVLASWARRAKEATAVGIDEGVPVDTGRDEPEEEELFAALEEDEEFAISSRRSRSTKSPARRKAASTSARKAKAKPATARKSAAAKSTAKSTVKRAAKPAAKRKPAARKAKPKPTTSKAKAPRRRPETPSE